MNDLLSSPSVVSDVSLGKSIPHLASSCSLRITNSLSSHLPNVNASLPSRMEVSSGKSSNHSLSEFFTLEHCITGITECIVTEQEELQAG